MHSNIVQAILEDRGIAYVVTDRDLNVVEVSNTLETVYFTEHNNYLGLPLLDLVPEFIGNEDILSDILEGNIPRFQLSWINRETAPGRVNYLTLIALPYQAGNGWIQGLLHLIEDVTEIGELTQKLTQQRNELELLQNRLSDQNDELAAANAELQKLSDMKSKFVSIAAHELRTPLSAISGYVEVLLDEDNDPLSTEQRSYLEVVQRGADRLLTITNDLLDVARIETGRIELLLNPTNLSKMLKSMVSEFGPIFKAKAQHLSLEISSNLPLALIDENRTSQIISNLLSNAGKYTYEGGQISVRLSNSKEEGFLLLTVADSGVGIATDDQDKLFSRFFRAESSALTNARGAGLGLHITRSLVELHGGQIWFESELGQGSTFYTTFPIAGWSMPDQSTTAAPMQV